MPGFFPHQPDLALSQEMREFVDPEGNRYRNVREAFFGGADVGYFAIWMWVQNGRPRGPQMEMSSLVWTIQLLGT